MILMALTVMAASGDCAVRHDRAALLKLEQVWNDAIAARDAAAVEPILAEDFTLIAPNGALLDRAATIAATRDRDYVIAPFKTRDVVVKWEGCTAAVAGWFTQTGSYRGQAFTTHIRYTDLWRWRDGRWQAFAAQATRMAAAPKG